MCHVSARLLLLVYVMPVVPESSRVMSRRFCGVRFKFQCGSFNVECGLVSSPFFAHIHVTVNMRDRKSVV